jgi:Fur family ferric uptake transcriptional regulator
VDLEAAHEILATYLKDNGQRATPERVKILDEVMKGSGHFDADELYAKLRSRNINVSRGTVYNTLDILVKCGLISKYRFGENHSKYEKAFGRPRHDHLICLSCGDIIEFVNEKITKLQEEVCREKNFKPQNSTFQVFGICSKCQRKREG